MLSEPILVKVATTDSVFEKALRIKNTVTFLDLIEKVTENDDIVTNLTSGSLAIVSKKSIHALLQPVAKDFPEIFPSPDDEDEEDDALDEVFDNDEPSFEEVEATEDTTVLKFILSANKGGA